MASCGVGSIQQMHQRWQDCRAAVLRQTCLHCSRRLPTLQEQDVVVAGEGIPFDQMEEDSSSEGEDDDEALLGAEEHFDLGAPGGGAGLAGLAGGQGGHPLPQVQRSAAETLLRAVSRRNTRARNRLRVPLTRPIGANILLVKLISQVWWGCSSEGVAVIWRWGWQHGVCGYALLTSTHSASLHSAACRRI